MNRRWFAVETAALQAVIRRNRLQGANLNRLETVLAESGLESAISSMRTADREDHAAMADSPQLAIPDNPTLAERLIPHAGGPLLQNPSPEGQESFARSRSRREQRSSRVGHLFRWLKRLLWRR